MRLVTPVAATLLLVAVLASWAARESFGHPPPDTAAPAKVADLRFADPKEAQGPYMTLTWSAPADDGPTGRAAKYEVYYFTSSVTDKARKLTARQAAELARGDPSKFSQFPCEIKPGAPGTVEKLRVSFPDGTSNHDGEFPVGPKFFQNYWFVVAVDEAGNRSDFADPADEVALLAAVCKECHDTPEHRWPQQSGKHLKHVVSNHFRCVVCHSASVDEYFRYKERHDNKSRDVVMHKWPTARIFNPDTLQCAKACHKSKEWEKKK
ncbi:MAG: hypothetical protein HY719_00820 [Planctomycetes bacterium]|nr:hypothetical protein [Planctomycetota bacterium]